MALVPMGEAAQRLGVSVDTIRRRLRKGELQGQHRPTPQGFIWLVHVDQLSALAPTGSLGTIRRDSAPADAKARAGTAITGPACDATPTGADLHAFRELVDVLRHEIDTRDRQLEAKDGQIEQLHLLLKQAQSVFPASNQLNA